MTILSVIVNYMPTFSRNSQKISIFPIIEEYCKTQDGQSVAALAALVIEKATYLEMLIFVPYAAFSE